LIRLSRRLLTLLFIASFIPGLVMGAKGLWALSVLVGGFSPPSIAQFRMMTADEGQYAFAIETALEAQNYREAQELIELATSNGFDVPPDLVERARVSFIDRSLAAGHSFGRGAILGSSDNAEEIAGTILADLLVIGDIRDLAIEGKHLAYGEPVDHVILGLSAVGVLTSVPAIASVGAASPADIGLSLTKATYKARRLSAILTRSLRDIATRVFDWDALSKAARRFDWRKLPDPDDLKSVLSRTVRQDEATKLTVFAADVASIAKAGGARAGVVALGLADNPREIQKMAAVARVMGDRTATVLKFTGKSIFRIADILVSLIMTLLPLLLAAGYMLTLALRLFLRIAFRR